MRKLLRWVAILMLALVACAVVCMLGGNRGSKVTATPTADLDSAPVPGNSRTLSPMRPTPTRSPIPTYPPPPRPDLELLESSAVTREYSRYIVGRVRNNSKRKYGYVQIQFNLLDGEGNQVGSTMANVNNLEPGRVWAFEALIFEDRTRSYKFAGLTGF